MVDSKENYKFDLAGKKLNRGRLEMGLEGGGEFKLCRSKNLLDPFLKLCSILKILSYLQSLFYISCIYFPFSVGGVGQSELSQARKISLTCPFW